MKFAFNRLNVFLSNNFFTFKTLTRDLRAPASGPGKDNGSYALESPGEDNEVSGHSHHLHQFQVTTEAISPLAVDDDNPVFVFL